MATQHTANRVEICEKGLRHQEKVQEDHGRKIARQDKVIEKQGTVITKQGKVIDHQSKTINRQGADIEQLKRDLHGAKTSAGIANAKLEKLKEQEKKPH